jgi:hypothetical protein
VKTTIYFIRLLGKASTPHFVDGLQLAIDEHPSHVIHPEAPSVARVVYDYYGGKKAFPVSWDEMMVAVDKGDSARFNRDEILHPQKWDLMNFLMDARTGLDRFHEFASPITT